MEFDFNNDNVDGKLPEKVKISNQFENKLKLVESGILKF